MNQSSRRSFLGRLAGLGGTALMAGRSVARGEATSPALKRFKLGSITDEWSQDFEDALKGMKRYGLHWVEIRTLWNIYNTETTPEQLRQMKDLLAKYEFRVSVLDTAVYKCTLPGTKPVTSEKDPYPYSGQMDLLKRGMERAHALSANTIRVFAFWRVAKPAEQFPRIAEELSKAADVARGGGFRLVLENESICNVATGAEQARMMQLVPAANFGMNWDIGNGYWQGETSYPDGYTPLPKKRIWHMHLKDVKCAPQYKDCNTAVVGTGQVKLLEQLRALVRDGYDGTMSLEPEYEDKTTSHREATERSLQALLKLMEAALA
ncbi:MAG: sugar phosphate isomerase/epimerase family protein [Terriglobia bacterium]